MHHLTRPSLRFQPLLLPLVWWPQQTVTATHVAPPHLLPSPRLNMESRARALVSTVAQLPCAAVFLTGCDAALAAAVRAAIQDPSTTAPTAAGAVAAVNSNASSTSPRATSCAAPPMTLKVLGQLDAARGKGTSILLARCNKSGPPGAPAAPAAAVTWTAQPVAPSARGGGSGAMYAAFSPLGASEQDDRVVVAFTDVAGYRAAAAGLQAGRAWAPEPRSFRVRATPCNTAATAFGAFPLTGAQAGARRRNDSALDTILGASEAAAAVVVSGGRFGFSTATWGVNALVADGDSVGPSASLDAPESVLGADAAAFYDFPSRTGPVGIAEWADAIRDGEFESTSDRTAGTATSAGVLGALKELERDPCRVLVRRPDASGAPQLASGLGAASHRVISGVGVRRRAGSQSSPTVVALSPHRPVLLHIDCVRQK